MGWVSDFPPLERVGENLRCHVSELLNEIAITANAIITKNASLLPHSLSLIRVLPFTLHRPRWIPLDVEVFLVYWSQEKMQFLSEGS